MTVGRRRISRWLHGDVEGFSGPLRIRHASGSGEATGTGIKLGAGVRYAGRGVSVEGSVRTLLAHEASGCEEWGASGAVRIDPGASGRGLSLTLSPTVPSRATRARRRPRPSQV